MVARATVSSGVATSTEKITVTALIGENDPDSDDSNNTLSLLTYVDAQAPTVELRRPASGGTLRQGETSISGVASDGRSGVGSVEVRVQGSGYDTGWQPASGTAGWTYSWTVPDTLSGQVMVSARATDLLGNSNTSQATLTVDTQAATAAIGFGDGQLLGGAASVVITGTASDDYSVGKVEINIDGEDWAAVNSMSGGATSKTWYYNWTLPEDEDGVATRSARGPPTRRATSRARRSTAPSS